MRRIALIGAVTASLVTSSSATAEGQTMRGPFLLVALPSLGTLTWRCDPAARPTLAPGLAALGLGFRSLRAGATTRVRLRVDERWVFDQLIQPGQVVRFPFLRARSQLLTFLQGTGAGTLRARVRVTFVLPATGAYCERYTPPRVDAVVWPRR